MTDKLLQLARRCRTCVRGNVMVITAAVMPLLIGAGAVGIDVAQWSLARRQLQRMADSAALAGGHALNYNQDVPASVTKDLQLNNKVPLSKAVVIENAPKNGPYKDNLKAVRVVLETTPTLAFVSYFMSGAPTLTAEATAAFARDPKYCMAALDQSTPVPDRDGKILGHLDITGDTDYNCGFHSNAAGPNSLTVRGSTTVVKTSLLSAVGTVNTKSAVSMPVMNNQPVLADPFLSLPPANSFASGCLPSLLVSSSTTVTLPPGCWNGGVTLNGNVTLLPGVYVINGGDLNISGSVSGTGVTFILTGGAASSIGRVEIAGGSTVNLAAPQSGTLAGVLFYQDRRTPELKNNNRIAGNSSSKLEGNLYFPKTTLTVTGSSGMAMDCFKAVAFRLQLGGNSTSRNVCPEIPVYQGFGEKVRLVW